MRRNISSGERSSAEETDERAETSGNLAADDNWNIFRYARDKWNQFGRWRSPGLYDDIKASTDNTCKNTECHDGTSKVNFRYSDGSTPLTRALKLNDQKNLEYLLQVQGIDLSYPEKMVTAPGSVYIEPGQPPLIVAVVTGRIHLVKQLLDAGADVNAMDENKYTALYHSVYKGYTDITHLLLQHHPVLECDENRYDPIHVACQQGNFTIAKMLINAGCCVDPCKDNMLVSPLQHAISNSSEDICLYLLEHGADRNNKGNCDFEPFLKMCQMGLSTAVEFCVNTGSNVNMRTEHGMTPLMLATKLHNYNSQRCLLFSTTTKTGRLEPGACELYQRRIKTAKCLINANCDLDLTCEINTVVMTALSMAVKVSNLPVAVVLLKHGAAWDENCHIALKDQYRTCQREALIPNFNVFILKRYIPKVLALIPHMYRTQFQQETNQCFNIPTLKDACRKVIRERLKVYTESNFLQNSSLMPLIPSLNLPTLLKDYLCYNEIHEEDFSPSVT